MLRDVTNPLYFVHDAPPTSSSPSFTAWHLPWSGPLRRGSPRQALPSRQENPARDELTLRKGEQVPMTVKLGSAVRPQRSSLLLSPLSPGCKPGSLVGPTKANGCPRDIEGLNTIGVTPPRLKIDDGLPPITVFIRFVEHGRGGGRPLNTKGGVVVSFVLGCQADHLGTLQPFSLAMTEI